MGSLNLVRAIHSYAEEENQKRARQVLRKVDFSFLLVPTSDPNQNLEILNGRLLNRLSSTSTQQTVSENYLR